MARLNETKVQALIKAGRPCVVSAGDRTGLALRITAAGVSWQLRYRHAGKPHWLTLGKYPECGLTEARKKATRERARIDEGVDPVAERRRSRLALKAAKTFEDLWLDYERRALAHLRPNTQKHYRLIVTGDVLPRIGSLRRDEVTPAVIVDMVESIGRRSLTVADRAFVVTSLVFSHGQAKHLVTFNPCAGLKLKAILGKRRPVRELVSLSESELGDLMVKLPRIGRAHTLMTKIILACAVRKSEVRLALPEHVDFEQAIWTIPAENAKNGKEFKIPLVPIVMEWFCEAIALREAGTYIFPGAKRDMPISGSTLNRALSSIEIRKFTVHDLRRTARTHLARLGVDIITAEKCLNHSVGGLVDVYDRGDYLEERRRALQVWADFLVRCESPAENVVSLRKAG